MLVVINNEKEKGVWVKNILSYWGGSLHNLVSKKEGLFMFCKWREEEVLYLDYYEMVCNLSLVYVWKIGEKRKWREKSWKWRWMFLFFSFFWTEIEYWEKIGFYEECKSICDECLSLMERIACNLHSHGSPSLSDSIYTHLIFILNRCIHCFNNFIFPNI